MLRLLSNNNYTCYAVITEFIFYTQAIYIIAPLDKVIYISFCIALCSEVKLVGLLRHLRNTRDGHTVGLLDNKMHFKALQVLLYIFEGMLRLAAFCIGLILILLALVLCC